MPRKPKLMFQVSQNESLGFGFAATGATAADAMGVLGWMLAVIPSAARDLAGADKIPRCARDDSGYRSSGRPEADRLAPAGRQDHPQAARGGYRLAGDRDRERIVEPVRLGPVGVDLRDVAPAGRQERE